MGRRRATDCRADNNVAESTFARMRAETHPTLAWDVCAVGTGGTSATFGRYVRSRRLATRVCVADPEGSVYLDACRTGRRDLTAPRRGSSDGRGVEGIGRPRVEASFLPAVIDRCVRVPDACSHAIRHVLSERLRRRVGGSTGTDLLAAAGLIAEMRGERGSIVTLICDGGDRYATRTTATRGRRATATTSLATLRGSARVPNRASGAPARSTDEPVI